MERSHLKKITDHVYILAPDKRTDRPILGVIWGKSSSLIIDAGNSPAHARLLLHGMAELNFPKPKYLVITHGHWDHVFGASIFNVPIISNFETKLIVDNMVKLDWSNEALDRRVDHGLEIEFCREMIKAEMPQRDNLVIKLPDIIFNSSIKLDLGGIYCHITKVGGDHSSDSSIVNIPEEKVIFLGDCLYPNINCLTPSFTKNKFLPLLDLLLSTDADYYLASHDAEPMTRKQIVEYETIAKLVYRMIEEKGMDRESIVRTMQATIEPNLPSDTFELVDGILTGLSSI